MIVWNVISHATTKRIDPTPRHILRSHGIEVSLALICSRPHPCNVDEEVTCVAIGEDLDLVISGSKDGTCVLHALFSGKYLRTIRYSLACMGPGLATNNKAHRCGDAVERLGLSSRGEIVICTAKDILLYSINGTLLAQCPCEDKLTYMQVVPSASMGTASLLHRYGRASPSSPRPLIYCVSHRWTGARAIPHNIGPVHRLPTLR